MQACTCSTPASTAASEFATATSASLWQWMPSGMSGRCLDDLDRIEECAVIVPPLVSQRTRPSAPALAAALQAGEGVVVVGEEAVEEVLGVEEHALARCALGPRPSRRSSPGSLRASSRALRGRAGRAPCRRCVTTRVPRVEQRAQVGVGGGVAAGPARAAEGDELALSSGPGARTKNSASFGIGAGQAAFDVVHAQLIELAGDRSLSSTESEMPSICAPSRRVVS